MTPACRLTIVFLALLPIAPVSASAQEASGARGGRGEDSCDRFKMQVIAPRADVDHKLQVVGPAEGVEYKGLVTAPCPRAGPKVISPPLLPGLGWRSPLTAPSLKQPPASDSTLKSPADMLKRFGRQSERPKPPR